MINAEVLVDTQNWKKIIKNPEVLISNTLKKFPKTFRFDNQKVYISILLTTNKKIKLLNKKFRKKNKATDILSFPFFDKKNMKKSLRKKEFYLGDIVISYEEFLRKNKKNYKDEFIKIFIHGFLHLLNFDHKSNKDHSIMSSKENKIFKKVKG
tara:strand:+ start:754 stop:1212 length:459 start_codon:yes stop_codon:yes gene_type:complete